MFSVALSCEIRLHVDGPTVAKPPDTWPMLSRLIFAFLEIWGFCHFFVVIAVSVLLLSLFALFLLECY